MNNFAISSAEIGEGMNNAASMLAARGNSLEQSIGILAAANATVQNISKASTGIRTIAARIGGSVAELEELGESVDNIMSTAKLDAKMRAFGVSIVDTNGELRSTYDILNDLHDKWDDLDTVQRAAIENMLAGTRQGNIFGSLMSNWDDAKAAVEGCETAQGTLAEAQEKYLNSIDGKLDQLNAIWQSFSENLLDSDIVKFFIDTARGILTVVDAVGNAFDGLGGKIILFAGVFTVLMYALSKANKAMIGVTLTAKTMRAGVVSALKSIGAAVKQFLASNGVVMILSLLTSMIASSASKIKSSLMLVLGVVAAVASGIVLYLHFVDEEIKLFESSNPLGWILLAITAIISVVKGIVELVKICNPSYEDLKEKAQDSIKTWEEAKDKLQETVDKLKSIQEEIDKINAKDGIELIDDKQLKDLEQAKANLELERVDQEQKAKDAKKKAAQDAASALAKYNDTNNVGHAAWWEWALLIIPGAIHEIVSAASGTHIEKLNEILKDYKSASDEDKKFVDDAIAEFRSLTEGFDFGDDAELDKYLYQYYSMLDRKHYQIGNQATVWARILKDTRFTDEIKELQALADAQGVTFDAILAKAPSFVNYLKEIGIYVEGDAESTDDLVESIKKLRKHLAKAIKIEFTDDLELMQDKFDSLNKALEDIEKNGVVSMDNIAKIIDENAAGYPSLLSKYFEFVDGVGYQLAKEWSDKSVSEILTAMAKDDISTYQEALDDAIAIQRQMEKELEETGVENEDYGRAVENVAILQENLNLKTAEWATLLRSPAIADETERLNKLKDALGDQKDAYKDLIQVRKDLLKTYKEEVDYQKELAKKQKNLADLQTQLALAQLDNSAAGQALARELQSEITKAQEELDEYTLEKAIDDLTKQLDSDAEEYEKFIQEQVDKIVETINNLARDFKINFNDNGSATATSVPSHHSGGFVGAATLRSNEEFAKLLNGELVSTPKQMDTFMKRTLPAIITSGSGGGTQINNNAPLVEITCGSVDADTLPKLKDLVNQAADKIMKNMESALGRTGYKKKY